MFLYSEIKIQGEFGKGIGLFPRAVDRNREALVNTHLCAEPLRIQERPQIYTFEIIMKRYVCESLGDKIYQARFLAVVQTNPL